ncbi:Glycoside hydrolase [Parasponia andersonii]|uniref:Glycoside hydrolase n=1 Tax=Parasponia andersonii TaxID=3476 RepID=A0A2P5CZR4_PARAD|nr:Glycoside hydrolase [Parasponia andersonii]
MESDLCTLFEKLHVKGIIESKEPTSHLKKVAIESSEAPLEIKPMDAREKNYQKGDGLLYLYLDYPTMMHCFYNNVLSYMRGRTLLTTMESDLCTLFEKLHVKGIIESKEPTSHLKKVAIESSEAPLEIKPMDAREKNYQKGDGLLYLYLDYPTMMHCFYNNVLSYMRGRTLLTTLPLTRRM